MRRAIVLVFDRLSAGFLGPYGNTWAETPRFNRLAAESAVFEFALSDSPDLQPTYGAFWSGWHACSRRQPAEGLPHRLAAAGVPATLITDSSEIAHHPLGGGFQECVLLPPRPCEHAAKDVNRTQLAGLMLDALQWLERASGDYLLWLHARALNGPWDAPLELRHQFVEEEDPLPPDFVTPPVRRMTEDEDPDRLLGIHQAYAGQIGLIDQCLGAFLDACAALPGWEETLLLVTSPRGYPLGEHGRLGPIDDCIFGETLHVPCLIRYPHQWHAMTRNLQIVQPSDLQATLAQWFEVADETSPHWGVSLADLLEQRVHSDRAVAVSASCHALRTEDWFLHAQGDRVALYAKPDDRWEANEVAVRCQDLIPELQQVIRDFQQAAAVGDRRRLAPLPEISTATGR